MTRAAPRARRPAGARPRGRPASLISKKSMPGAMTGPAAACKTCGTVLAPRGGGAGAACRRCAAGAGRTLHKDCKECGRRFDVDGRAVRYCSDGCRSEAARRRNREHQRKYMADPERRAITMARARAAAVARAAQRRGGRPPPRQRLPRADPNAEPSICALCGRSFAQYGRSHRHAYCRRCTARFDREAARTLRAKCRGCGGRFSTASRAVHYCSDECRAEGLRRSRRESRLRRRAGPGRRGQAGARTGARNAARRGRNAA